MQKRTFIFSLLSLGLMGGLFAQETENIGTETVTVVKPYSPTVSDAFKIRSLPSLEDSIVLQKKEIQYSIFSVPVASTFTPAKGKASGVERTPPPKLFNSYVSAGMGNYNNALLDFYTSREFSRGEDLLDFALNHNSSRGDLDHTPLEADFSDTRLDVSYGKRERDRDWGARLGLTHRYYNWYGIEDGAYSDEVVASMDPRQQYFNAELSAYLSTEDSFFQSGKLLLRRFWDRVASGENRLVVQPTLELPIAEENFTLTAKLDYVGGRFQNASLNSTTNTGAFDYAHMQVGIGPSISILREELTLDLGANLVYGLDLENSDSNFYLYPAVTASYRIMEDNVIAYGGIEGQLEQNSYHGFVDGNPYVSPTLDIMPTDRQYEGYLGIKGKLVPSLGYNLRGSYLAENKRPLYLLNPINLRDDEQSYFYGNSFQVFYDDVKTLGIFGELNLDINRNFSLGASAEFYDYDTETDNPAWNLPSVKGSLFMDYQIDEKWFLGAALFYVGEREDLVSQAVEFAEPFEFPSTGVTLDGFFDANAHVGHRFTPQLSVFIKVSNLAGNSYQRWANFRVQGFQALGGLNYKFDF